MSVDGAREQITLSATARLKMKKEILEEKNHLPVMFAERVEVRHTELKIVLS